VQLIVSMVVDLPASGTVDDLEPVIVAAGQQAMRSAMQAACREYERQAQACPHCASPQLQSEGSDERRLQTSFGRVPLHLRRLRCEACGRRFRPADPFLASLAGSNVTSRLRSACVLAGSSWPYTTAALVLHELCGAAISAEWVRQLTNAAGIHEATAQWDAAQALVTPPLAISAAEQQQHLAEADREAPAQLLVALDGGWVPSRDQRGGMEGKVGVVAAEAETIGRHGRRRLSRRRYVATFGDADRIGVLTYAAAQALDGDRAQQQTVLGDGASWIKTQARLHFPAATTILDWGHVERAVHKAIRAARPGAAHRALRRQAHQVIPALLWRGEVDAAVAALAELRPPTGEPVPVLEETLTYLRNQRGWLGDYQTWRDAGEPIGSGMVEREVALVINRRMKRQGMRWRRVNADAIAALRVRTINASWDHHAA
jgi:Uncharacterised protein family (UPF0236)